MAEISYDDKKHKSSGYLKISDDRANDKEPALAASDRKRLLNLMWWCVYSRDGRVFLHENWLDPAGANPPGQGFKTEAEIRATLQQRFRDEFGVVKDELMTALIDGHLAAVKWVNASNKGADPQAAAAKHWKHVYQQNLSFITWQLWEDAMGNEFSMAW